MPTIAEARKQFPELADLNDNDAVDVLHSTFYQDMSRDDVAKALGVKPVAAPAQSGQFASGFKRSFQELPALGAGALAYGADVVGADGARDKLLKFAKESSDATATQHQGDAASITDAWDGKSNWSDFLANAAGYVAGQALQSIASGGLGALGVKALARAGVKEAAEAAAAKAITEGASEAVARQAALDAAAAVGNRAAAAGGAGGAFAHNLGMETGSIYPDAVEEAQKEGRELTAADKARVGMASILAAGVDTGAEAITASKLLGGSKANASGIMGRLAREVPQGMLREGGTEAAQTAIEHYGAGQPIADEKGMRDIIDSAGIGMVGGGMGGGAASVRAHESVGDQLRAEKMPETGPMTRAANAGIENQAQMADAGIAPPLSAADQAAQQEAVAAQQEAEKQAAKEQQAQADEEAKRAPIFSATVADIRNQLSDPEAMAAVRERFGDEGTSQLLNSLNQAQNPKVPEGVRQKHLQAVEEAMAVVKMKRLPDAPLAVEREQQAQLEANPAPLGIPLDTSLTGTLRVDGDGNVAPETRADAISTRDAVAEAQSLGKSMPRGADRPVPPPTPNVTPTGEQPTETTSVQPAEALAQPEAASPAAPESAIVEAPAPASSVPPAAAAAPAPDRAGPFDSPEAAETYISQQRRNGGSSLPPALPRRFDDGSYGVVTEGNPEFAAAQADDKQRALKAVGVQEGDVLNKLGAPFTVKRAAITAQKKSGGEVVAVKGGFVVRPTATVKPDSLAGDKIDDEWTAFAPGSGTKGIPRADMPQIRAEHRGAMTNFLNARGIEHEHIEVPASDLKPTQAEFSPAKVEKAKGFTDTDRSILVSSDGHVLDGHHQWLAKHASGEPVKAIRLNAPIDKLLSEVKEFPSATTADGAANASIPQGVTSKVEPTGTLAEQWQAAVDRGDKSEATRINDLIVAEKKARKESQAPAPVAEPEPIATKPTPAIVGSRATESVKSATEESKQKLAAPAAAINDFGEKLVGARKDYAAQLKDAASVDSRAEPLSVSWPEPDYQKQLDAGTPPHIVAWMRAARDEVPTKPQSSWKLSGWVKTMEALRGIVQQVMSGARVTWPIDVSFHTKEAAESRASLYEAVGHAKSLKGISINSGLYSVLGGVRFDPPKTIWTVSQRAKATAFSNWPRDLASGATREEAIADFKAKLATLDLGAKAKGQPQFVIYGKRGKTGAWIGKKIGREYVDLKQLDDVKAARTYLADHTEDLEAALAKYRDTPVERRAENQPRVGDDHRNGAPVSPEIFADTFGFRGVQFGNYVEQGRRQSDLNEAYDGLMDMAAVLGVPPRALSLNGRLGLAFGARGKGGKGAFAAHFEPDQVVINLTKGGGPGSLAHEWWHAADNYFARISVEKSTDFVTAGAAADRMRGPLRDAFRSVITATQAPTLRRRAAELDKRRNKEYWNTPHELSARAFESYVIAKLDDQGAANDYLANVVDEKVWNLTEEARAEFLGHEKGETYPYPGQAELPAVRAAFDNFFKVVDTRTDEAGNAAMFSRPKQGDESHALKALSENDDLFSQPKSDKTTVEGITADIDPQIKVSKVTGIPGETRYNLTMPDGKTARIMVREANAYGENTYGFDYVDGEMSSVMNERPGENAEHVAGRGDVWLDVSLLSSGKAGGRVYNIAATFAHNTDRVFIGDPAGLSNEAVVRRPEHMLSSALKFGTTNHLAPHPRQVTGDKQLGVPPLKWVYGDHEGNIRRLIDLNLAVQQNDGSDITFDPTSGKFLDSDGQELDRAGIGLLAKEAGLGRGSLAGGRTLARSAVLRALLREEGGPGESGGQRDGVLARLAGLGSNAGEATRGIFYARFPGSRGGEVAPAGRAAAVESFAEAIAKRWVNAPKIVVVDSMSDPRVPADVLEQDKAAMSAGSKDAPAGFFHRDTETVYLVADQLDGDVQTMNVLFHETLGHFGLRRVFGSELGTILDRMAVLQSGKVRTKAKEYGLDFEKLSERREAAEEVLAEMAEKSPQLGWVQKAIAAIRTWMREHVPFFAKLKQTDAEIINNYILPARRFVQQGGETAVPAAAPAGEPAAAFSRTLDTLKQAATARGFSDLTNDLFATQKTFNGWHRTIGTQYHKATVSPEFKKVYDRAQDYLHDTTSFATDAAAAAPDLLPQLNSWRDLGRRMSVNETDRTAVSKAVFQGTLTDLTVYSSDELRSKYGLSDHQIELYKQFRASVDRSLDILGASDVARLLGDQLTPDLKAMVSEGDTGRFKGLVLAKLQAEKSDQLPVVIDKFARIDKLKSEGYAPLMRFGRYTVDVMDGQGERTYFGMYESEREANAAARQLKEPGVTVTKGVMSQEAFKQFQGVSPETLELFAEMAGVEKNELFQQYLKLAVANRSALKRMIERKGIAGFSEDPSRVLASFVTSNARAASGNMHLGDLSRAVSEIPKQKGDVLDEAQRLKDYVQNPQEEAQAIRGLLFTQYIGGSIASAMVNMTQPLTMTYPFLAQHGGAVKAAARLMAGIKGALTGVTNPVLKKALAVAEQEGIVSPQEIHQLQAEASRSMGNNQWVRKGLFLWGSLFSLAEQFNRRATFIAAYNTAVSEGIDNAFDFAADAVGQTQGIYNKANKPNWARGAVGGTLFTFKQFSIGYMEFLKRLPPKERALALAVLMVAAGAQGLPGADDLDDVIDTIAQYLGYDFSSKQQKARFLTSILGAGGSDFMLRGFSALPGFPLDVAGRMSVGNLIPGTGMLLKSKTDKSDEVAEVAGPAGSVLINARKAIEHGDGTAVLPTALANIWKGLQMYQTGQYKDGAGRKVMDVDAADALIKGIGFQPAEVARASRSMQVATQQVNLARNTESDIASAWARGVVDGDPDQVKAARERLADWNEKNPESRIAISRPQIMKRAREMRMARDERFNKSVPKEMRATVQL